ncbi:hypothetical protein ANN_05514, partial [Periplaneta americana]
FYREKYEIEDEVNDTLSYLQNSTYYFSQEKSGNLSEDDVVTFLNVALVGTAQKVKDRFGFALDMMGPIVQELFTPSDTIFLTGTVREVLWDGLEVINCNGGKSSMAETVCGMVKPNLPVMVSEHEPGVFKAALFRHKNNTNDGRYRISRGLTNNRNLGEIEDWNGDTELSVWAGAECNMINGTDSTIFPPFWTPNDKLYIFVADVCRSLYAEFESEIEWKGVKALHYTGSRHNMQDPEKYPPNKCFCLLESESRPLRCLKEGVLNLINCLGVSIIASFPHLYNASMDYREYAEGLFPDRMKHQTFIDIEPVSISRHGIICEGEALLSRHFIDIVSIVLLFSYIFHICNLYVKRKNWTCSSFHAIKQMKLITMLFSDQQKTGTPLRGAKRMQFNMFLTRIEQLTVLTNVSEGLFPLLWIEEGAELDDKNLALVKKLYTAMFIMKVMKWVLLAAGVLLMCFSLYVCLFKKTDSKNVIRIQDSNRVMVSYDNKAYGTHKSEALNDTLTISDINDFIHNDKNGVKKRKSDMFPGKSHSRMFKNRTEESVGLGAGDPNKTVTLGNVFM